MRVMLTGATGFVGFHSALRLLEAGHELSLLVRNPQKMRVLFGRRVTRYARGDLTDRDAIRKALAGCDALIHSAAMVSVDARDAQQVYDTNVNGTRAVIECALERNLKSIIHVSSVTALFDPRARVLDEHSPPGGATTAYGRSKVACETFVRELQQRGAPIHISYPGTVIGPDDPGLSEGNAGLLGCITALVPLMPGGNQFLDVRDLADLHLRLLARRDSFGRWPLGGHLVRWRELPPLLERATGRRIRRVPATGHFMRMAGRVVDLLKRHVDGLDIPLTHEAMVYATRWVRMDNAKVERELGIELRPLERSLAHTVRWLREAGHLQDD